MNEEILDSASQDDAQNETQNPPAQEWEWVYPEDGVAEVYADFLHVNWTSLKLRIRFTQIIADPRINPSKARWVVEERAAVTVPWFTAKVLHGLLDGLIKQYEEINGEIKLPQMPQME